MLILINNDNEGGDYDNNNNDDDDNQDNVVKDVTQLTAQTYWEKEHPGCSQ